MTVNEMLALTEETYKCPIEEKHLYHCRIEMTQFNAATGQRESKPRIAKFGVKMFEGGLKRELEHQGYKVDILFNPRKPYFPKKGRKAENN